MNARLIFPEYWDELVALEVENKGWFPARVVIGGHEHAVNFYDPQNLAIDVEYDVQSKGVFFECNLIVVQRLTVENMTKAVDMLPEGFFGN
ncbi:MAG: hypothetical protein IPL41_03425 [Micropruina sp.]|nr:hypothetical protein [Micropruina sp.]